MCSFFNLDAASHRFDLCEDIYITPHTYAKIIKSVYKLTSDKTPLEPPHNHGYVEDIFNPDRKKESIICE